MARVALVHAPVNRPPMQQQEPNKSEKEQRVMTLSTVDYGSKSEAYAAAELLGFDKSSVRIEVDRANKRYQWALREVASSVADSGEATVSSDDNAQDGAAGEPDILDAPISLNDVSGLDALISVVGDTLVTPSADAPIVTDITPVPAGWASVEGGVVSEPVSDGAGLVQVEPSADGEVAPIAPVVEPTAPVAGDLIMQLHGAMPAAIVMQFAQQIADKHMAIVTLRDAVTFAVTATVVPGMGGKRGVASVARGLGNGGVAPARVASNRPESIIDRIRARGEWSDDEVSATNLTILNLKHRIEAASSADDLDRLTSLGAFKSTSTYYNHARAYLEWHTAQATKRVEERVAKRAAEQAALDTEFGYSLAAD